MAEPAQSWIYPRLLDGVWVPTNSCKTGLAQVMQKSYKKRPTIANCTEMVMVEATVKVMVMVMVMVGYNIGTTRDPRSSLHCT